MTAKSSKLSKDNGWGGLVTDLEWDIFFGNPERLAKLSAYPVWNNETCPSYAWSWMLVKTGPIETGSSPYSNALETYIGRYGWWEKVGKPAYFWVNCFYGVVLPVVTEQTMANAILQQANVARRDILDKKAELREGARLKRIGITKEQERLLKEHKHNEGRYYKLEIRRANYLLRIQREADLLRQGSRFLEMPDEEFLEKFGSITNETNRALYGCLNGDLLNWLSTRMSIVKFRKENEAAIRALEECMPHITSPEFKL